MHHLFLVAARKSPLAMRILPCVGAEVLQHIAQPFDSVRCKNAPPPRLVLEVLNKSSSDMPALRLLAWQKASGHVRLRAMRKPVIG